MTVINILSKTARVPNDDEIATPVTVFERGQLVKWSLVGRTFQKGFFVQLLGNGPFTVNVVAGVNGTCISPGLCRNGAHHETCNVPRAEVVGHPQIIELHKVRSPFDGNSFRISGQFLQPA